MSSRFYSTRRLSVEIREETYKKLQLLLPHGMRKTVFSELADEVVDMLEAGTRQGISPEVIAGAIAGRQIGIGFNNLTEALWHESTRPETTE
jgi:hypothetical protein